MKNKNTHDHIMDISDWIPYRMWWVARNVASGLRDFYKPRFGLNPAGWRALANIGSRAPLSSKLLGQYIGLDPVQTSRAVDGLVRKRLVTRKADKEDRRRVELNLSKKGEAVYASISTLARALENELFNDFSKTERKVFSQLLSRMEDRISNE